LFRIVWTNQALHLYVRSCSAGFLNDRWFWTCTCSYNEAALLAIFPLLFLAFRSIFVMLDIQTIALGTYACLNQRFLVVVPFFLALTHIHDTDAPLLRYIHQIFLLERTLHSWHTKKAFLKWTVATLPHFNHLHGPNQFSFLLSISQAYFGNGYRSYRA